MLNEDKIRLMSRLSIYEEKTGKDDLKINGYYHVDYIGMKIRKTIAAVTIAFALELAMAGFYYTEELLGRIIGMDYKALGIKVLIVYLILIAIYIVVTVVSAQLHLKAAKKRMSVYMKDFRHLRKHYERMERMEESE